MTAEAMAAWLLTFAVHGTVLLGALQLGRAWLRRLPDAVQETLLRFALLAPLLSATLQVTLVDAPAAGHVATVAQVPAPPPPGPPALRLPEPRRSSVAPMETMLVTAPRPPAGEPAAVTGRDPSSWSWLVLAALLAALSGLALGLRLRLRLWRILRCRRPVESGPTATELKRLQRLTGLRRRVRLSTCATLQTPIAFGILRPEICLPSRALELGAEHRSGVLAHELAHIARRDPLWLCAVGLIERLFCWQPLIRLVRVRLRELAEYRADAWAARLTGGLSLARCLLAVADWVARQPRSVHLVPGMAQGGSNLKSRIERLLAGQHQSGPRRIWAPPVLIGLLLLMTSALPGAAFDRDARVEPAAARTPIPELLFLLQQERESLQLEVEALHDELPPDPVPELVALMSELHRRLESVDRRRVQLLGWLLQRERNH